ncbi:hypothetical protein B566_EDAN001631 [Ephemera danica]|nr:hypothetical protein B566_EDAN001631 [Ephemera danica]
MEIRWFWKLSWPGLDTNLDTVAPIVDADPWASDAAVSSPEAIGSQQEGWADFCSFAPATPVVAESSSPALAAGLDKDVENNADMQAEGDAPSSSAGNKADGAHGVSQSEDTNANPNSSPQPLGENSELVDNYRFLSQGLMSSSDSAPTTESVPAPSTSTISPLQQVEMGEASKQDAAVASSAPKPTSEEGEAP